jgi:hypothetical protein
MHIRPLPTAFALILSGTLLSGAALQPRQPQMPAGHPAVPQTQAPAATLPGDKGLATDVESIDSIIKAFYTSTSGLRGEPRQWERFRHLFSQNARLIPVQYRGHGEKALLFVPAENYIDDNRKYLEKAGFSERELSRRIEQFGSIAHVFSTYESRRNPDDAEPYSRGIYSFQLAHDGQRWYIVNVMWDSERPEQPLPPQYLLPQP